LIFLGEKNIIEEIKALKSNKQKKKNRKDNIIGNPIISKVIRIMELKFQNS